jgi:hypothetical protein
MKKNLDNCLLCDRIVINSFVNTTLFDPYRIVEPTKMFFKKVR